VLGLTGGVWSLVPNICNDTNHACKENYYAITDSTNGLYVVGTMGVVSQVNPALTVITSAQVPGYAKVLAGATRSGAGALFVGVDGGFFTWPAGNAAKTAGLPPVFLRGVAVAGGDAWVVGHEGFVAKVTAGQSPTTIPTPDQRWLVGVYAASASDLWVVGRSGAILRGPPGVRGVADGGVN